jgi:hypothetical protein
LLLSQQLLVSLLLLLLLGQKDAYTLDGSTNADRQSAQDRLAGCDRNDVKVLVIENPLLLLLLLVLGLRLGDVFLLIDDPAYCFLTGDDVVVVMLSVSNTRISSIDDLVLVVVLVSLDQNDDDVLEEEGEGE